MTIHNTPADVAEARQAVIEGRATIEIYKKAFREYGIKRGDAVVTLPPIAPSVMPRFVVVPPVSHA